MATVRFFRDSLTLTNNLSALTNAGVTLQPGDMLVLGARLCTIMALPGDFNYVIGADKLMLGAEGVVVSGTAGNRSPNVTLLAAEIDGLFNLERFDLECRAMDGVPGNPGAPGEDGEVVLDHGKPKFTPPTPGGRGGPGGAGSPGGAVIVHYCTALQPPVATARGGNGGAGGPGGPSGDFNPDDPVFGKPGKPGPAGPPGTVDVTQVSTDKLWTTLDPISAVAWAAYRTEVGLYFFRLFDFASQILALREFTAALQLDPANADARTLLNRIVQQQTPTGLSRDIDISPDYKDLSANLPTEVGLVQNAFAAAAVAFQSQQTAEGLKDQFASLVQQLTDRQTEAQDSVKLAQGDVEIASKTTADLSDQIKSTQNQLQDLQNQPFSLGTFLSNVGSLAASIASVATGIGAIVSIPGSIAAIANSVSPGELGDPFANVISTVLGALESDQKNEPDKTVIQNLSKIGGGLGDLVKDVKSNVPSIITNFQTIEAELNGAASEADQTKAGQLLKQLTSLVKQQMIAQLREKQARDRVAAAQRQVKDFANEAKTAQDFLTNWSDDAAFLARAVDSFIANARLLLDIVAEDVFLARRALEIYELDDASDVRFDYGYLHPDDEHSLPLVQRVIGCQNSVASLAPSVLTWNDVFTRLNVAQAAGFDVVHPAITISITDPTALAHVSSGGGLQFSIDAAAAPASIFELKTDSLQLELDGVSASTTVLFWIEHSGRWNMIPRPPNQSSIVEFSLFPHVEIFNCKAGKGSLSASIPAHPQSSTEPGPPFAFWGRGVITEFRIFPDASAHALDLSHLRSLNLTVGCIGLVAQGAAQPHPATVRPAPVLLPSRTFTNAAVHTALA
jgi:hypothetical protein